MMFAFKSHITRYLLVWQEPIQQIGDMLKNSGKTIL